MPISQQQLQQLLQSAFPDADIDIKDLVGDQDHYSITITDSSFANKTKIMQHKMVNLALESVLKTNILHAAQIKTIVKSS
jgi:stress-induced morphogen